MINEIVASSVAVLYETRVKKVFVHRSCPSLLIERFLRFIKHFFLNIESTSNTRRIRSHRVSGSDGLGLGHDDARQQ